MKASRESPLFAGFAPSQRIRGLTFRRLWHCCIIKELIERNFKSASKLFQRFYAGNSVPVFNARHIVAQQTRPLLNVALCKFLMLAKFTEGRAYLHAGEYFRRSYMEQEICGGQTGLNGSNSAEQCNAPL